MMEHAKHSLMRFFALCICVLLPACHSELSGMQGFSLQPTVDTSAPDEEVDLAPTLSELDARLADIGAKLRPGAEAAEIVAAG